MDNKVLYYFCGHTSVCAVNSGVQRVVRSLARALLDLGYTLVCVDWSDESQALVRLDEPALRHLGEFDGPVFQGAPGAGTPIHLYAEDARRLADAWLLVPEVLHLDARREAFSRELFDYARRFGLRSAAIVYDLIPLKRPEYPDLRERHSTYLQHLMLADVLVPISELAARDLEHFYRNTCGGSYRDAPPIRPLLLPHELYGQPRRRAEAEPDAANGVNILSLGTVEQRKNQLLLISEFERICAERPDLKVSLKLVGSVHPAVAEEVHRRAAANPKLEILHYAPDTAVRRLYETCHFTVFPSVEEGYGLPIAESLWFGVPCLCADFGSMAELSEGGGCLRVDTRSGVALGAALERLIDEAALRQSLRREAASRPLRLWTEYAEQLLHIMRGTRGLARAYYWVHSTVAYAGNSGVQRVARRLAASLEEIGVELEYVKWDDIEHRPVPIDAADAAHLAKWSGPRARPPVEIIAEEMGGAWLVIPEIMVPEPDLEQVVAFARGAGMRVALVFFDVLPVVLTEHFPKQAQDAYHRYFRKLPGVDLILPISRAMGRGIVEYFCSRLDRLTNLRRKTLPVPLGGDLAGVPRVRAIKPRHDGPIRILCVGTVEPRKAHLVLIHAFRVASRKLFRHPLELVIAGSMRDFPEYGAALKRETRDEPNIKYLEQVSDADLCELHAQCDFTVYPSPMEGFGLPLLESLWHGRPCICCAGGALTEIAEGGGCLQVKPNDGDEMGEAIARLAMDRTLYEDLAGQAISREIKSWRDYALDVSWALARRMKVNLRKLERDVPVFRPAFAPRADRPLLSVCISTYNRAEWLRHSLPLALKQCAPHDAKVEVLVVDNASADRTSEVVAAHDAAQLAYHRNDVNVGMLGNLAVTSRLARGEYVWILGDDDLLMEGAVASVLDAIRDHPRSELIYLNYAYTLFGSPSELEDAQRVISDAKPIAPATPSHFAREIRSFAANNENLFTAIYACVFRRDHAIAAYNQDTSGTPFSSMLTCIPTSHYVLNHMMDRPGYWIGQPSVVVNMNVSWLEWALIWHLERMPEMFDVAEWAGVEAARLMPYRLIHCSDAGNWAERVYFGDNERLRELFSMTRLLERCKHIKDFRERHVAKLFEVYSRAYLNGRVVTDTMTPRQLFEAYGLLDLIGTRVED